MVTTYKIPNNNHKHPQLIAVNLSNRDKPKNSVLLPHYSLRRERLLRQRRPTPSRPYLCQLPFSAAPATPDLVTNRNHQQEQQQINFQTLKTYYHLNKIGIFPSHILTSTRSAFFQVTSFPEYSNYAGSLRLCLNINLTRLYFWRDFSAQ